MFRLSMQSSRSPISRSYFLRKCRTILFAPLSNSHSGFMQNVYMSLADGLCNFISVRTRDHDMNWRHKVKQFQKMLLKEDVPCSSELLSLNLLDRLSVLQLLPLQTLCHFFLWKDRFLWIRTSSNHKLFSHSTTLTGDLKG